MHRGEANGRELGVGDDQIINALAELDGVPRPHLWSEAAELSPSREHAKAANISINYPKRGNKIPIRLKHRQYRYKNHRNYQLKS